MLLKQADETITTTEPTTTWHTAESSVVIEQLQVDVNSGLSESDAQARLARYGANELVERRLKSPLAILWEQLTNPLVLLLIFAAVISALLGKADSVIAIS